METALKELLSTLNDFKSAQQHWSASHDKVNEMATRVAVIEERIKNIEAAVTKNNDTWKWNVTVAVSVAALGLTLFKMLQG